MSTVIVTSPGTTSNEEFTVQFLGRRADGHLVTFLYEICKIGGRHPLGNWVLALHQIVCLAQGKTLRDLVVGATRNGVPLAFSKEQEQGQAALGLDPTTQVEGLRLNAGVDTGDDGTHAVYAVTFDTRVGDNDCLLGADKILAATKAGNQDIRLPEVASPGYLCTVGPVCVCRSSMAV